MAGELYVALVTSQKARARLVSVDPSAALAIEGVVGYLDHKSVPGSNEVGAFGPSPVFAVGEVCFFSCQAAAHYSAYKAYFFK